MWARRKDTSKANTVTKKAYLLQVVKEMSKSTVVCGHIKLISKETSQNSSHFFSFLFFVSERHAQCRSNSNLR